MSEKPLKPIELPSLPNNEIVPQTIGKALQDVLDILPERNYQLLDLTEEEKEVLENTQEKDDEEDRKEIIKELSDVYRYLRDLDPESEISYEYKKRLDFGLAPIIARARRMLELEKEAEARSAEATGSTPPLSFPRGPRE